MGNRREEILNQLYISVNDLKELIPTIGIHKCREILTEIVNEEENKGVYVPHGKTLIAPTKAVKKRLGI